MKLAAVASDILGNSGRDMLAALVAGVTDPAALAELARGKLRAKLPQLERALAGRFGPHQRFLVAQQLAHLDALEETIERVSAEIAAGCAHAATLERLDAIPGVGAARRRCCWRRSAPTSPASRTPPTWPPGPGCARGTTPAPASTAAGGPARATPGCAPPWWRPARRPGAPSTPTSARGTPPGRAPGQAAGGARAGARHPHHRLHPPPAPGHDVPGPRRALRRPARPPSRRAAPRPPPGEPGLPRRPRAAHGVARPPHFQASRM